MATISLFRENAFSFENSKIWCLDTAAAEWIWKVIKSRKTEFEISKLSEIISKNALFPAKSEAIWTVLKYTMINERFVYVCQQFRFFEKMFFRLKIQRFGVWMQLQLNEYKKVIKSRKTEFQISTLSSIISKKMHSFRQNLGTYERF